MSDTSQNSNDSILDRVLHSQQSVALERFDPAEVVNELLKHVSAKEADVVRRRFGLGSDPAETLEAIGQHYKVTRERVRQIERWAIQHLNKSNAAKQLIRGLDVLLQQLLEEHGGLMREDELYENLLSHAGSSVQARAAIQFLLEEMLTDKVERIRGRDVKPYWKLRLYAVTELDRTIAEAEKVIRAYGKPMESAALLEQLKQSEWYRQQGQALGDNALLSYLGVTKRVERNPFGEWGVREWGSIVPKRMNDKILLVLRKSGKPMHFTDITKRINEIGFDDRQAYPPTVHNELILSKEYVLVGRGIYALREWGYKPGVVADVIEDILRKEGSLSRDQIVEKVLAQRMVKRNTIHLALTNKQRFQRAADGRYTVPNQPVQT
jgi:hypothetical protein